MTVLFVVFAEVVTPCRAVEPVQDPNDPLWYPFRDTTTISEHATVVGGNWMDEPKKIRKRALSVLWAWSRTHPVNGYGERVITVERCASSTLRPVLVNIHSQMVHWMMLRSFTQSGFTWSPDEAERSSLERSDEYPTADFEASDEDEPDDPDQKVSTAQESGTPGAH